MKSIFSLMSSAAWTEELDETSTVGVEKQKGKNDEGKWTDEEECEMKWEHFRGEMHWGNPVESEEISNIRGNGQSRPNKIRSSESMDQNCEENEEEEAELAVSHMFVWRSFGDLIFPTAEEEEGRQ